MGRRSSKRENFHTITLRKTDATLEQVLFYQKVKER